MERVDRIWKQEQYQKAYKKLVSLEEDRIFCRHTLEHFLDVARLAYIYNLEEQAGIDKELIYAAALLHDIGRVQEYEDGTSHDIASVVFAEKILPECGFSEMEIREITEAIEGHRNEKKSQKNITGGLLATYLKKADKKSRNCMVCSAEAECKWSMEKKNFDIEY